MRITIGFKIFGVAVVMLVLMAGAALLNTRQAVQLMAAFSLLADDYLEAFAKVSEGEVHSVTKAFLARRYFLSHLEDRPTEERRALLAEMAATDAAADAHFAAALLLLRRAAERADNAPDARDLARTALLFELAMEDRRRTTALLSAAMAALEAGDRAAFLAQEPALDVARDRLLDRLDQVKSELHRFVQRQAQDFRDAEGRALAASGVALAIALLLGLAGAFVLARNLSRPVQRLVEGARAVEAGRLDLTIPVTTSDEVGRLTEAFNRMIGELRTKERIRETFGKYVDPKIVAGLIDRPDLTRGEGERREMTVAFTDLRGFTALGEGLTPPALVRVINAYLTEMSRAIRRHDGIIDKFIGDAVMAYWGPPFVAAEAQVRHACAAALDQMDSFDRFRQQLPELLGLRGNAPDLGLRIGIATGDVVVGDIGSDVTRNYTVLGDTVNLASRLEGVNKLYGTSILLSEQAAQRAGPGFALREIDRVAVAGKAEPERIHELLGRAGDAPVAGLDAYAEGLAAWRAGDWATARRGFAAALAARPGDGPAQAFLRRLESPPAAGWDGVWRLDSK